MFKHLLPISFLSVCLCLFLLSQGQSKQDAANPLDVRVDSTFESISVRWNLEGDDNQNSSFTLFFREEGSSDWQEAAPAMRSYPTLIADGQPINRNDWAASVMFLDPSSTYDLKLVLDDSDGGSEEHLTKATTRTPLEPTSLRTLYVAPGDGGGDGSESAPFLGLQSAADNARGGDTFLIKEGRYQPFQLLVSGNLERTIALIAEEGAEVVIDGNGTDRGIITLGEFDQTIGYIILRGLTIQNGMWGVDAQHAHNIDFRYNTVRNVFNGYTNRREDALEHNQTICENSFEGLSNWPGNDIPNEKGIRLMGTGNVVCHNKIRFFGDCVDVQPYTGPSFGNDIYGNDIAYCVDDGIEIDYNESNVRVWRNRVVNARTGVSLQPIKGGPAYVFRNELINLDTSAFKLNNSPVGFYLAHNTAIKHGNAIDNGGTDWSNAILRNNLMLGTRYAFEFIELHEQGFRDLDYNGWGTSRTVDSDNPNHFKWDNVRYGRVADLPEGIEDNGLDVSYADLVNGSLPMSYGAGAPKDSWNVQLEEDSRAIDAGTALTHLNDAFRIQGDPDLGAFEYGEPLPHYGPRN